MKKHLLFLSFTNIGAGKLFEDQNTEAFVLVWFALHVENYFLYLFLFQWLRYN